MDIFDSSVNPPLRPAGLDEICRPLTLEEFPRDQVLSLAAKQPGHGSRVEGSFATLRAVLAELDGRIRVEAEVLREVARQFKVTHFIRPRDLGQRVAGICDIDTLVSYAEDPALIGRVETPARYLPFRSESANAHCTSWHLKPPHPSEFAGVYMEGLHGYPTGYAFGYRPMFEDHDRCSFKVIVPLSGTVISAAHLIFHRADLAEDEVRDRIEEIMSPLLLEGSPLEDQMQVKISRPPIEDLLRSGRDDEFREGYRLLTGFSLPPPPPHAKPDAEDSLQATLRSYFGTRAESMGQSPLFQLGRNRGAQRCSLAEGLTRRGLPELENLLAGDEGDARRMVDRAPHLAVPYLGGALDADPERRELFQLFGALLDAHPEVARDQAEILEELLDDRHPLSHDVEIQLQLIRIPDLPRSLAEKLRWHIEAATRSTRVAPESSLAAWTHQVDAQRAVHAGYEFSRLESLTPLLRTGHKTAIEDFVRKVMEKGGDPVAVFLLCSRPFVRAAAARALRSVVPLPDKDFRWHGPQTLEWLTGHLDPMNDAAMSFLEAVPNVTSRQAPFGPLTFRKWFPQVFEALGRDPKERFREPIMEYLFDPAPPIRVAAAGAMVGFGVPAFAEAIQGDEGDFARMLASGESSVSALGVNHLTGGDAARLPDLLTEPGLDYLLGHHEPRVRVTAREALELSGDRKFKQALRGDDEDYRRLAETASPRAAIPLTAALFFREAQRLSADALVLLAKKRPLALAGLGAVAREHWPHTHEDGYPKPGNHTDYESCGEHDDSPKATHRDVFGSEFAIPYPDGEAQ